MSLLVSKVEILSVKIYDDRYYCFSGREALV